LQLNWTETMQERLTASKHVRLVQVVVFFLSLSSIITKMMMRLLAAPKIVCFPTNKYAVGNSECVVEIYL